MNRIAYTHSLPMNTPFPARLLTSLATVVALSFAVVPGTIQAGTPAKAVKTVETPAAEPADSWQFNFGMPVWLASTAGIMGVNGVTTDLYIGADTIIGNLDMTASLSGEARKGRFGMYGDLLYISASDGVGQSGLVEKVGVRIDQYLINAELSYRLVEGPRGFVDARAGVRYTNLYNKLTLAPNDAAIDGASAEFVDDVGKLVAERLAEIDLRGKLRTALERRTGALTDRIAGVDGRRPRLPVVPLGAGVPARAEGLAGAAIERRLDALAEALRAEASAATARLRAQAARRVDALKKQIAEEIASDLKNELNASYNLAEDWWDPYVGVRARLNLSKAFYLLAKADVGGFGVGSDLTWQASGALGWQVTERLFTEIGYHYLYTDYNQNGFVYDVSQSGIEINAGITF